MAKSGSLFQSLFRRNSGDKKDGGGKPKLQMPLVELHCHIEGSVRPALAQKLAERHGERIDRLLDDEGRYKFADFMEFMDVYDAVAELVRTEEDYFDITVDYLTRSAEVGLKYVELGISSAHVEQRGLSYHGFLNCLESAVAESKKTHDVDARFILTVVRHWGVEGAFDTALKTETNPHPLVTGLGIAGDETYRDPREFRPAFEVARGAGLGLTAHSGEIGPNSIRATLDALPISRLGHGVRAIEEPDLIPRIRGEGITLENCPSSNVALGLFPSIEAHPVAHYLEEGLNVTVSTDDPPFFDTQIDVEYDRVARAHSLAPAQMIQFTKNAIEAAFCEPKLKDKLRRDVAAWEKIAV